MDTINNSSKSNYVLSASVLIAAVLIAGAVIYSKGAGITGQNKNEAAVIAVAGADPFIAQQDDIVLGDANAPVTIFLYSDPSCPFCAAADGGNKEVLDYLKKNDATWTPPIPGIIDNYVNSGKVKLIYRYYPGHGTAGEEATKILYCANEQGKFWELHKAIADNQSVVADSAKVKNLASGIGADVSKIEKCLESGKYNSKIIADTDKGSKAGVNGTPAFFVNKVLVSGAQPFSAFKIAIDAALQSK